MTFELLCNHINFIKYLPLLLLLFAASVSDIKEYRIPNLYIISGLSCALAIILAFGGNIGEFALTCLGLFLFGMLGIFGAGDIKLWMVIAGFLGFIPSLYIFIASQFLVLFYALITAPHEFGLAFTSPIAAWQWFKMRKVNNHYYPLAPFLFVATMGWLIIVFSEVM